MTDRELSAVPFDMSSFEPAPIVLLVYNRPDHTRKTLTALSENFLADKSRLIVFADGPKKQASSNQLDLIRQTREVLVSKKWCKEVEIHEADENKGLARSVTDGVSSVVEKYGKAIILEDDILTSRGFLTFMNQALEFYEDVPEVMQIAGYFLPVKNRHELPSTFFYNVNSCWGWATWQRAWKEYREDAAQLLTDVKGSKSFSKRNFNKGQGDNFHQQLIDNVEGRIHTWAVKWHASMFLKGGFCLHPSTTFVRNIGIDGSGTYSGFINFGLNSAFEDGFEYVFSRELIESEQAIDKVSRLHNRNIFNLIRNAKRWLKLRCLRTVVKN